MRAVLIIVIMLFSGCSAGEADPGLEGNAPMARELIVLAASPDGDGYYQGMASEIFQFHVAFARELQKHDDVLILAGDDHYDDYVGALGAASVARIEMYDIWMRDFSPQNAAAQVMFRYTAEGQGGGQKGQREADIVQAGLSDVLKKAGLRYGETNFLNDGGNFVDDGAGNVVLSRKFLRDNALTETDGRTAIQHATGAVNVAFIEADEQGGLEHADAVVAFIDENVLVVNAYLDDPAYSASLRSDLEYGLPGVMIHEIVAPYDATEIYDTRFGSACGLYTNMLVTPERIYLPQFGIPEDALALASLREWTRRDVIPVMSAKVCRMGGGVRCMSWQLRGENALKLKAYAASLN
ncbi:MAG: agmatine deiminase family protein [Pseudomonadota bacterium]